MRNLLIAASAIALLGGFASAANATVDNDTIQVNAATVQGSLLTVHNVKVGDELTGGAQAVGNDISLTSYGSDPGNSSPTRRNGDDIRAAEVQVNVGTLQAAVTNISDSKLGSVDVSSEAIGNTIDATATNANFDPGFHQSLTGPLDLIAGQDDGSSSIQANVATLQTASLDFTKNHVVGGSNLGTVAVGDNLNVTAGANGTFSTGQLNLFTAQLADTTVHNDTFGGNSNLTATAIGNIASDTANSPDFGALQGNILTAQLANLSVTDSTFKMGLSATSVSAGNVVNVSMPKP